MPAIQAFCPKHDIRPYRPTYRFLRGDPAKQAAAHEDLTALKKKAAAFSVRNRVRIGSGWYIQGPFFRRRWRRLFTSTALS